MTKLSEMGIRVCNAFFFMFVWSEPEGYLLRINKVSKYTSKHAYKSIGASRVILLISCHKKKQQKSMQFDQGHCLRASQWLGKRITRWNSTLFWKELNGSNSRSQFRMKSALKQWLESLLEKSYTLEFKEKARERKWDYPTGLLYGGSHSNLDQLRQRDKLN